MEAQSLSKFLRAINHNSMSRTSIRYRHVVRSPSLVSHTSLAPMITPSLKHKARSSASVSVLTSLISALKLKSKGKKSAQKVLSQRARSLPPAGTRKQIARRRCIASSADGMEVEEEEEDFGEEVCTTQYVYYDASENPFATPPCTPVTRLSPMMLDDEAEATTSSPDIIQSRRKRRDVERSRMKTLQLLGSEACMAISEQYGDMRISAWDT
ncbi:hypothetical protein C0993_011402 [Termitomyces sp. T159_Od127]|nr:hypothetical protein C0993_011402 [Termitomyces sp. T159_Od127]